MQKLQLHLHQLNIFPSKKQIFSTTFQKSYHYKVKYLKITKHGIFMAPKNDLFFPCTIQQIFISCLFYIYQSQFPSFFHPPPCLDIHDCSLCLRLYFCFMNRFICTIFSRFHIYALIYQYDICFSLSGFLCPIGHCLCPSPSLQVAPLYNLYYIKVNLKNAFQYTVGTDK